MPLIACHDCDLIHWFGSVPEGSAATCSRCGAMLYQNKRDSLERTLALTVTGLILFVVANTFPFLGFKLQARVHETVLITGIKELFHQGMWILATVVLLTTIVLPAVQMLGVLYVLLPIKLNRIPWKLREVFRIVLSLSAVGHDGSIHAGYPGFHCKTGQNGNDRTGDRRICIHGLDLCFGRIPGSIESP